MAYLFIHTNICTKKRKMQKIQKIDTKIQTDAQKKKREAEPNMQDDKYLILTCRDK